MDAFLAELPFVNSVAAGGVKDVHPRTAEAKVGWMAGSSRHGDDEVHAAGLIADLDSQFAGDVQPAFAVHGHSVQRRFVGAIG